MQLILTQTEIEQAIVTFVGTQLNIKEGHQINVDLRAGRGENGFNATIDIVPASATPVIAAARTAPAVKAKEVKEEVAPVDEEEEIVKEPTETVDTTFAAKAAKQITDEDTAVDTAPAAKKSIFASVGRVVNTAT